MQRSIVSALTLTLAATLAACTATAPTTTPATATPSAPKAEGAVQAPAATPEDIVAQQSKAYWLARISGNVEAAYAFTAPSYRKVHDLEAFRLKYGARPALNNPQTFKVHCSAVRCTVTNKFQVFTPLAPTANVSVPKTDVWVQEDGKWWVFVE